MPATNTHPRYARIPDSRKSSATWTISTLQPAGKPYNICLPPSKHLHSNWGTARHVIARPHRDQRPSHGLLILRQAIRTSDCKGSRTLPPSNSGARQNSEGQGFETYGIPWWITRRCLHFAPRGVSQAAACDRQVYTVNYSITQPDTQTNLLPLFED